METSIIETRASGDGHVFGVLTEDGQIVGLTPEGQEAWTVDVASEASAFHPGRFGREVAVVSPPFDIAVLTCGTGKVEAEITCSHGVKSLFLLDDGAGGVVAAGARGELSRWDLSGEPQWNYNLEADCGRVEACYGAEIIALPATDEGIQAFYFNGEGAGAFDLGDPVTHAGVARSGEKIWLGVVSQEKNIAVMDLEGLIYWEYSFDAPIADFCFSPDASLLIVATTDRKVVCFRAVGPGRVPGGGVENISPTEASTVEETFEVEGAEARKYVGIGAPRPKGASLIRKEEMSGEILPEELNGICVTPGGDYVGIVCTDGHIVGFNRSGELVAKSDIKYPAAICKKRSDVCLAAWNSRKLVGLELGAATSWELPLEPGPVRAADCTERFDLVAFVNEQDELVLVRRDGKELARKVVQPGPTRLFAAPTGTTLLTQDAEGRLRFFDARCNLQRKQRVAGKESFDQIVLEDGFCALGGSKGRVIVQDMGGNVLWTDQIMKSIKRMTSLENTLAIYGGEDRCLVLNPYGEIVIEFEPPPGLSLIRTPHGKDPVLLHARRNRLTCYGGYHRKLNAQWSFRCDDKISVFEADKDARFVAIAAGPKLYFVEGPQE
ncbi:MAG: hypothetical protein ACLFWL_09150 [Candidatus Brocadiia bacterium]